LNPEIAIDWVVSSFRIIRNNQKRFKKRISQVKWILNNIEQKQNVWFYFDVVHQRLMFLNGTKRNIRSI